MTMSESITQEIARIDAPRSLIREALPELRRVLPDGIKPETFGQWSLDMIAACLANPKQAAAWSAVLDSGNGAGITSVMVALRECASLGLQPGSEYYLLPFYKKNKDTEEITGATVTGMTGYKGEIRLITNHEPCSVIAMLRRANDGFAMLGANIPPRHDIDWESDRGPIVGGYAYVAYGDGRYSLVTYMRRSSDDPDENTFDKHQRAAKFQDVWTAWYEQMCVKTLVHATRKMVPWSAERKW